MKNTNKNARLRGHFYFGGKGEFELTLCSAAARLPWKC
jgi:hypothetical protein